MRTITDKQNNKIRPETHC